MEVMRRSCGVSKFRISFSVGGWDDSRSGEEAEVGVKDSGWEESGRFGMEDDWEQKGAENVENEKHEEGKEVSGGRRIYCPKYNESLHHSGH